jgi:hypothetical protein
MNALRRFLAILQADLRERTRTPRFWVLLTAMVIATWWCFPSPDDGYMILAVGRGARGLYSSAWVGMVLAMAYSMLLGLGGFYLVRGTLVRDIETRVWQLLVATPMTRAGFLLAKWASHMVILGIIVAIGLCVGLVAQWLRAEDRHFDLLEATKPILLLSLPGLAITSTAAIWFDLLPWLRKTAGNVVYFVAWIVVLAVSVSQLEVKDSPVRSTWLSDPNGLVVAARDFQRVRTAQTGIEQEFGFSLGQPRPEHGPEIFTWRSWTVRPMDLAGRALWLLLAIGGVLLAAPLLDYAAARSGAGSTRASGAGRRLRWLDRLLRPFERGPLGTLAVAELRLVLRERRIWWWLAALVALGLQCFGQGEGARIGLLLAWALPLDILARGILREREHGTGGLVFVAPHALGRVLAARFLLGFALVLALTAPGMLRMLASAPASALAALVIGASIVSWGLCLGALFRNPRPFELLLSLSLYLGLQGAALFDFGAYPAQVLLWHASALLPAWALLAWAWPRMARN